MQFFNPNPSIILLQLSKEFHNWIKCGKKAFNCVLMESPIPPLPMVSLPLTFLLPFTTLLLGDIIGPLVALSPLVMET
jgi:hypothetical protein